MCTLSLWRFNDGLILNMNRDERIGRIEGEVYKGSLVCFPTDKLTGGTWCGYNKKGVAMALLNRYQDSQRINKKFPQSEPLQYTSRGLIIPNALKMGGYDDVIEYLNNYQVSPHQPFDLIVVSADYAKKFSWTGFEYFNEDLLSSNNSYFISSSSVDHQEVLKFRHQQYEKYKQNIDTNADLKKCESQLPSLHTQRFDDESHAILMSRKRSHTKSVMQIILYQNNEQALEKTPQAYYLNLEKMPELEYNTLINNAHEFSENENISIDSE